MFNLTKQKNIKFKKTEKKFRLNLLKLKRLNPQEEILKLKVQGNIIKISR